ncbi:hypothetical protein Sfulv_47380 [Streptomyces fulvorobeus]|uniref:PaaX family transcriptional regulator n=1 Tax=Streptomyces fulvorobeus TaxID=284028 RepID=A0A7J0CCK0_9ACTN|nr:hypothetical protein Sfulv_47380 [Streptomyces fulvorobeus]
MAELHTPRSLIVSLYCAYGRSPGNEPLPVAELIRLLRAVGVDAPSVRSSVSRLKHRQLLVPARTADGSAGYALSADARQQLDDGDRRIYEQPEPQAADGWVLAVFSVPEAERHKRHLLRSRLGRLGFGTAAPGVWIAPAALYEETRHTLDRLELAPYVDLFRGEHLGFAATSESVARWWDLDAIARLHLDFLERQEPVLKTWEARPPQASRTRRRPTGTTSRPWTPGGSCRTRTPACRRSCCRRTGQGAARPRCSDCCTRCCATPGSASYGPERRPEPR